MIAQSLHYSLHTAILSAFAGSVVVAGTLLYLSLLPTAAAGYRLWAAAFSANALRYLVLLISTGDAGTTPLGEFLSEALQVVSSALILLGAMLFAERRISLAWSSGAVAVLIGWAAYAGYSDHEFLFKTVPLYALSGIAYIVAAALLFRTARADAHGTLNFVAITLILNGLHKLDYPFLRPIEWAAPWGFLAANMLQLLLAMAIIVTSQRSHSIHRERERARAGDFEQALRDFAEVASDWFWEMDETLRFTYFSERMFLATGVRPDTHLGKRREDLAHEAATSSAWRAHMEDLRLRRPFRDFRYRSRGPDGSTQYWSISGKPVFDGAGRFKGYRGIGRNVTIDYEAVATLNAAKEASELANRSKSEFLANMSHELRTPLNAILGFSEIIRDRHLGEGALSAYSDYAGDIYDSGSHLLDVINDILDMSKIEAGRYELQEAAVDIEAEIRSCVKIIAPRATEGNIDIQVNVSTGFTPIRADQRAVKQLILNLLSNAVKFTQAGGRVTLSVRQDMEGTVVTVADTGVGVAPEALERIFEPFYQAEASSSRRFEGTGLGLSICSQLMQLHGGTLTLTSEVGTGTVVTATFPPERTASPKPNVSDHGPKHRQAADA
ncbi:MAG: sensor histidine kinase [Inquilinaceae bacterium]